MKKRFRYMAGIFLAVLLLSGCGEMSDQQIQEQLQLGQKYLTEMKYDEAIAAFAKVIRVDPKNVEANRRIASAYSGSRQMKPAADALLAVLQSGEASDEDIVSLAEILQSVENADEKGTLAQMAYTQTGDSRFLPFLFVARGLRKDFDGLKELMDEVSRTSGMKEEYLQELVQFFYSEGDYDSIHRLAEILKDGDGYQGMSLVLNLLEQYETNGEEGILTLLESYYLNGEALPAVAADSEIYIGEYDENGQRSGFGICYYGVNVKPTSRIYVGYWENGVRSGEGRAYRSSDFRIQCSWKDDYPEGEVDIIEYSTTERGTLSRGHVNGIMNLYEGGEWVASHCEPDASQRTGYAIRTNRNPEPSACVHVEKHTYCWDCEQQEGA